MTKIGELVSRVSQLEETVSHLTTHHDEQFVMVRDNVSQDTCNRLFNVNLQRATKMSRSAKRNSKPNHRNRAPKKA